MKKNFLILVLMLGTCYLSAQQNTPSGAYWLVKGQHGDHVIDSADKMREFKILKDGYWIFGVFSDSSKSFVGTGGGSFTVSGNQYKEKVRFFSYDTAAINKIFTFTYKMQGSRFFQEGVINISNNPNFKIVETWEKIIPTDPLQDASLEGAWQLVKGEGEGIVGFEQIKVYSYPRFAWAQYNNQSGKFIGAGAGTYQFDGKTLTEKLDYITYDFPSGTVMEFDITKPAKGQFQQVNTEQGLNETWKKAK